MLPYPDVPIMKWAEMRRATKWVLPNKSCVEVTLPGKEVVGCPPDVLIKMQDLCQHLRFLGNFATLRLLIKFRYTEDFSTLRMTISWMNQLN